MLRRRFIGFDRNGIVRVELELYLGAGVPAFPRPEHELRGGRGGGGGGGGEGKSGVVGIVILVVGGEADGHVVKLDKGVGAPPFDLPFVDGSL